jgi:hypothetical protein
VSEECSLYRVDTLRWRLGVKVGISHAHTRAQGCPRIFKGDEAAWPVRIRASWSRQNGGILTKAVATISRIGRGAWLAFELLGNPKLEVGFLNSQVYLTGDGKSRDDVFSMASVTEDDKALKTNTLTVNSSCRL